MTSAIIRPVLLGLKYSPRYIIKQAALRHSMCGRNAQIHSLRGTKQCSHLSTFVPRALKARVDLANSCVLRLSTELICDKGEFPRLNRFMLR
jgi:hypothetical protein